MTKKVKVCLCLFSGRNFNGLLHQQNFVFHYSMPNKEQHRCPMNLGILYNLAPLGFHKLCKFWRFLIIFKALGQIVVQSLK